MAASRSIASQLEGFRKVASAAIADKARLPKEAGPAAAELDKRTAHAQKLNSQQEKLKADLKKLTADLRVELTAAGKLRTKILRLAEAIYGTGAPELVAFRGAGEK